jgi:hypothetical protein
VYSDDSIVYSEDRREEGRWQVCRPVPVCRTSPLWKTQTHGQIVIDNGRLLVTARLIIAQIITIASVRWRIVVVGVARSILLRRSSSHNSDTEWDRSRRRRFPVALERRTYQYGTSRYI